MCCVLILFWYSRPTHVALRMMTLIPHDVQLPHFTRLVLQRGCPTLLPSDPAVNTLLLIPLHTCMCREGRNKNTNGDIFSLVPGEITGLERSWKTSCPHPENIRSAPDRLLQNPRTFSFRRCSLFDSALHYRCSEVFCSVLLSPIWTPAFPSLSRPNNMEIPWEYIPRDDLQSKSIPALD